MGRPGHPDRAQMMIKEGEMAGQRTDRQRTTAVEIASILVRNCGLDANSAVASQSASLAELGMDSLALLELQAVIADRYQVRIPEDSSQLSIIDLAELVDRQVGAAGTSHPVGPTGASREPVGTPGHTENSVVIGAPRQLVWELTNDINRWTELFTEYRSVEVLEQMGTRVLFRLTMFPDENGIAWSWVSERILDPARYEVRAHRVETGPFMYMHINWRYEEVPDGTRMTWIQDFDMWPSAPLDTARMTDRINANSRVQLDIIRDRIERVTQSRALDVPIGGDGG